MIDLSPLLKGLLPIIGIAISLGQYSKLEHWAREQAADALVWKTGLPYFFPHQGRQVLKSAHARAVSK